jgi:rubrerythrin
MYTMEDVRDIAVQIERNGEKTYRSAGERATDARLAGLLFWMADEEHRHAKWFENLAVKDRIVLPEHREMEAMGRSLLQEMVKHQTFSLNGEQLEAADNMDELLIRSMDFEQDTILFYDMLKSFINDKQTTAQLDMIIDEERGHVKLLKKIRKRLLNGRDIDFSCLRK